MHHPEPELVLEATEFYYGDRDGQDIAATLRNTRQSTLDGKMYGEVNLQLSLVQPILRELYPEAKYIWLLRDGRDVVASMYYRGWYDAPERTKVSGVWHLARLQGDRTGDFTMEQWRQLSRFEKCCWIWKKYNLVIENHLSQTDPSLWRRVDLEQFKASLPELEAFLGLRSKTRIRVEQQNVAMQDVTRWDHWTADQRSQFEAICGDEMDRWYPTWRSDCGEWQRLDAETPDRAPLSTRFVGGVNRLHRGVRRRCRAVMSAAKRRILPRP